MTFVNDELENSKKRKKVGPENVVASPRKSSKLDESTTAADDNSSLKNTQFDSQNTDSSSQQSGSSSQSEESSQDETQKDVEDSPKKCVSELGEDDVFTKLLKVFSEENPPSKTTYDGSSNLTQIYNEFWTTFYDSPSYSTGNETKLPQAQRFTDLQLKSMAKIIKRGWEEQRIWPKKLFRPLLECSLIWGLHTNLIWVTSEMFTKYIENTDKALIQDRQTVDQNILNIFEKYCPGITVSIGDDTEESCKKAAMLLVKNMEHVIVTWANVLTGLMPTSTFHFIMNESLNPAILQNIDLSLTVGFDDMGDHTPPHQMWETFFLGWPEDKITYYWKLLHNNRLGEECNLCGNSYFNAKHFISSCEVSLGTTRVERHDAVLRILDKNLDLAIKNRNAPYLSTGNDWKVICMYDNERYQWPEDDLGVSFNYKRYPHLMAYSTSPKKKVLIIELSVSWEHWIPTQNDQKSEWYTPVKKALEKNEFEVEYRVFVLGSRGVIVSDLKNLLEEIFGLDHKTLSEVLHQISQAIIDVTYLKYCDLQTKLKQ